MKKSIIHLITSLLIITGLAACNATTQDKEIFKEYDLSNPDEFNMPESLFEISGITFYKGNSDTVYAIQDEEGKLFRLAWDVKVQRHAKFGKKGDYEDVSILKEQVVILKSTGHLFTFPFSEAVYEEPVGVIEHGKVLPKGEYEGMYGDEKTGDLYVICKNCPQDDSKKTVSGYIVKLGKQAEVSGNFSINVGEIKAISGKVERGFRPSAIAKNPVTNEWYIVAAVNKLLVITDQKWKVKHAFSLNGNIFNQPEGIAFDKTGNMYISNEGDDLSDGNILKFVRKAR